VNTVAVRWASTSLLQPVAVSGLRPRPLAVLRFRRPLQASTFRPPFVPTAGRISFPSGHSGLFSPSTHACAGKGGENEPPRGQGRKVHTARESAMVSRDRWPAMPRPFVERFSASVSARNDTPQHGSTGKRAARLTASTLTSGSLRPASGSLRDRFGTLGTHPSVPLSWSYVPAPSGHWCRAIAQAGGGF